MTWTDRLARIGTAVRRMMSESRLLASAARAIEKPDGIAVWIGFGAILFVVHLALQWGYIVSDFVILDDTVYIAEAFFGSTRALPSDFIPYLLLRIVGALQSVVLIKVLSIATLALIGVVAGRLLVACGFAVLPALAAAAFISSYPLAPDQGFFVVGSHPSLGLLFLSAALWAFWRAVTSAGRRQNALLLGSAALAALASFSSPATLLAALAPLLWLAVMRLVPIAPLKLWPAAALLGWPLLLRAAAGLTKNHYSAIEGWTDYSIGNLLSNVGAFFAVSMHPIFAHDWLSIVLYLAGIGGLIFAVWLGRRGMLEDRKSLAQDADLRKLIGLGLCAFFAAALVAAPGLVVTTYVPRYATPAFFFGAALVAGALLWLMRRSPEPSGRVLTIALLVLIAANLWSAPGLRADGYDKYYRGHKLVAAAVERYADEWAGDAQVVFLLPKGMVSPSQGYNHWSTAYIRVLARRPDLIGLAGNANRLSSEPFVEAGQRDGRLFWTKVDGVSRRMPMKGLERDRPTYAYQLDAKARALVPVDVMFRQSDGNFILVGAGQSPAGSRGAAATCAGGEARVDWPVSPGELGPPRADVAAAADRTLRFDGANARVEPVTIPPNAQVHLSIRLTPDDLIAADETYSDSWPPMPFLSKGLSAYQRKDGIHFTSPDVDPILVPITDGTATLTIEGVEGCFYSAQVGKRTIPLKVTSLSGDWRLGKGYKDRVWSGTIEWGLDVGGPM